MRHLPEPKQPNERLLVGHETSDDGGVYQLTEDIALVQTVDYFTPVVDDPYAFGQIAAANALSDVYAMGGEPKTVLNIVGFPIKKLPHDVLAQILAGAQNKVEEAGAVIAGGHSIDDSEPKFGLSVTGTVHPERIFKNIGAQPGDVLVLTKPIGVGIVTTGIKRNQTSPEQESLVTTTMAQLNKHACDVLKNFNPHAVTDITGFGLLGHAYEMASGSDVSFDIKLSSVPILQGTHKLAAEGVIPGGSKANHRWLEEAGAVHYTPSLTATEQLILCDAITSGGLLVSLSPTEAELFINEFNRKDGFEGKVIGRVKDKLSVPIEVV